MQRSWRRRLPGRKHGITRSVGVFGTVGSDGPEQLSELVGRCTRLRERARSQGVTLANDAESLTVLDRQLHAWLTRSPTYPFLEHEIGGYLGTVILSHSPDARWRIWPNGHPVVH